MSGWADLAPKGAMGTFSMSLTSGWESPDGRMLAAGDLVVLEVVKPSNVAAGPAFWNRHGNVFWKVIGPPGREAEPVFCAEAAAEWEVRGYAIDGTTFTPGGQVDSLARPVARGHQGSH